MIILWILYNQMMILNMKNDRENDIENEFEIKKTVEEEEKTIKNDEWS